jgi:hypothetical protein
MQPYILDEKYLTSETRTFYHKVLITLRDSKIPFLAGGAYAFGCYTGIVRDTKDFDVFVHPRDARNILEALAQAGYKTELTDEVWLGKAFDGDNHVDVVFGSANGIAMVDDEWFAYACDGRFLDLTANLIPPEEMIWSKSFIMTRDRYDGADIAHIMLKCAHCMDWQRIVRRFGPDWRIFYNYLILFGYIYPSERSRIPSWVLQEMATRLEKELKEDVPAQMVCRGTLLSTTEYITDIEQWGYCDPRPVMRTGCSREWKVES